MAEPGFTLKASLAGGRRLEVTGELDLAASSTLRAALAEFGDGDGDGDVMVDLSAVTFIDSTALQVLAPRTPSRPARWSPDRHQPVAGGRAGLAFGRALHTARHRRQRQMSERPVLQLRAALAELALAVFTSRTLSENLERLVGVACRLIPTCASGSIAILVDGQPTTTAVTDHLAIELDLVQYDTGEGRASLRSAATRSASWCWTSPNGSHIS